MKWNEEVRIDQEGDTRTKTWFAWLPVTLYTDLTLVSFKKETRWLERVVVKQEYRVRPRPTKFGAFAMGRWENVCFVDKKEVAA